MQLKYIKNYVTNWRSFLYKIIFPQKCIICSKFGTWCCEKCAQKISLNTNWRCADCHTPSAYGSYCIKCQKRFYLDGLWVTANYDDANISKFIKAFKYKNIQSLLPILSLHLNNYLRYIDTFNCPDLNLEWNNLLNQILPLPDIARISDKIIIPVPLHPRRLRWRGFNQSLEIARTINANFPNCKLDDNLIRRRYQRPQAKLNKKQRLKNLRDGFIWQGQSLKNKTILLVDDVASTGTTLNECALGASISSGINVI